MPPEILLPFDCILLCLHMHLLNIFFFAPTNFNYLKENQKQKWVHFCCLGFLIWDFQVAPTVKNPPANACYLRDTDSVNPWSRRSPGAGLGNPLQYSCLENPMEEKPADLQSIGLPRVGHNWSDLACTPTHSWWSVWFFFNVRIVYIWQNVSFFEWQLCY